MTATVMNSTYSFMVLSCASAAILLFSPLKVNSHAESRVHQWIFYKPPPLHRIPQLHKTSYLVHNSTHFMFSFYTCTVLCWPVTSCRYRLAYADPGYVYSVTPCMDFDYDFPKGWNKKQKKNKKNKTTKTNTKPGSFSDIELYSNQSLVSQPCSRRPQDGFIWYGFQIK